MINLWFGTKSTTLQNIFWKTQWKKSINPVSSTSYLAYITNQTTKQTMSAGVHLSLLDTYAIDILKIRLENNFDENWPKAKPVCSCALLRDQGCYIE